VFDIKARLGSFDLPFRFGRRRPAPLGIHLTGVRGGYRGCGTILTCSLTFAPPASFACLLRLRRKMAHRAITGVMLLRAGYAGADASLRKRGIAQNTPAASFAALVA
jgi:hypothetical protein